MVKKYLDCLLTDREAVHEESDAITYPVLTLPVEIISQIFWWTLPSGGPKLNSQLVEPLSLGQICRIWRQIALSTPALWSTFHIELDHRFQEKYLFLTRTFLSRAASMPLSFSVKTEAFMDDIGDVENIILHTLASHSQAWENINFTTSPKALDMLHTVRNQLPRLRTLELILDFPPESGSMFADAPLLRRVRLSRFGAQKLALPWHQLTSAHLDYLHKIHLAEIIRSIPNLVNLIVGDVYGTSVHVDQIPSPNLRFILLPGFFPRNDILSFICAPQLEELKIFLSPTSPYVLPLANPASMQRLSLIFLTSCIENPFVQCLTPMPSIRTLKIVAINCTPFHLLVAQLTEDLDFIPELQSLTFIALNDAMSLNIDTLTDMLYARRHSLLYFEIRSRSPLPDLNLRARELAAKGMEIILSDVLHVLDYDFGRPEF
ncbi:F-box domain-containing protein [Mycena venus]|uniref:F-box domain-containing protein n=1 Tax=Mycena venus TaxID=2733690 RepID=A0A8H7DB35_9AGAR|nr:F-box domain-containing protein [Mycena venus]